VTPFVLLAVLGAAAGRFASVVSYGIALWATAATGARVVALIACGAAAMRLA